MRALPGACKWPWVDRPTVEDVVEDGRESRTDAYLCHFQAIDLHTDVLAWQDKYEVKYGVMRNKLD